MTFTKNLVIAPIQLHVHTFYFLYVNYSRSKLTITKTCHLCNNVLRINKQQIRNLRESKKLIIRRYINYFLSIILSRTLIYEVSVSFNANNIRIYRSDLFAAEDLSVTSAAPINETHTMDNGRAKWRFERLDLINFHFMIRWRSNEGSSHLLRQESGARTNEPHDVLVFAITIQIRDSTWPSIRCTRSPDIKRNAWKMYHQRRLGRS